jgi:hypothetical protein
MSDDAFDTATYYDIGGMTRELTHETPEEAILDSIDSIESSNPSEWEPMVVYAYRRVTIPDTEVTSAAANAVESFHENICCEYGDPDGDGDLIKPEDYTALEAAIADAMRATLKNVEAWACEICAERAYSNEEIVAIVRQHRPEWLKEPDPQTDSPCDCMDCSIAGEPTH